MYNTRWKPPKYSARYRSYDVDDLDAPTVGADDLCGVGVVVVRTLVDHGPSHQAGGVTGRSPGFGIRGRAMLAYPC